MNKFNLARIPSGRVLYDLYQAYFRHFSLILLLLILHLTDAKGIIHFEKIVKQ